MQRVPSGRTTTKTAYNRGSSPRCVGAVIVVVVLWWLSSRRMTEPESTRARSPLKHVAYDLSELPLNTNL
jgi:hypothetical protein